MLPGGIAHHGGRAVLAGLFSALATLGASPAAHAPRSSAPKFVVAATYEPSANVPGALACAGHDFCMQVDTSTLGGSLFPTTSVLVTRDGGRMWSRAVLPPDPLGFDGTGLRVACTAPGICVVGGLGFVARTLNGGETWKLRSGFPASWELGVNEACLDDGACVGVGMVSKHQLGTAWLGADKTASVVLRHAGALPDGYSPRAISCASVVRCVATGVLHGRTGVVLVATRLGRGLSWHEVRTVPHWLIEAIACPTVSVCVGVEGHLSRTGSVSYTDLVHSDDGGSTWRAVKRVTGPFLPSAISCTTAEFCATSVGPRDLSGGSIQVSFISSDALRAAPVSVFTTTDGGRSWRGHVVLLGVADAAAVEGDASCMPGGRCVADASGPNGGRTIAGPSNGALTTVTTVPAAIGDTSVVCTTGATCYRVDDSQGTTGYASTLLASADDGATWTEVALPPGDEPVDVGGCQGPATCEVIAVRGVTLDSLEQGNYNYGAATVVDLTTTDGGTSWSTSTVAGHDRIPQGASCSSSTQCTVVVSPSNGSFALYLLSTQDGATWSSTPVPGSGFPFFAFLSQSVYVTCGQGGTCLFYVSNIEGLPTFLRSSDGGATWIVATPPGSALVGMSCFASATCVIAYANPPVGPFESNEQTYLTETTDGGATWSSAVTVPTTSGDVASLTCATTLDCTALYEDGASQTTDGGSSWTALGWPAPSPLTLSTPLAFACSATTCLAVESNLSFSPTAAFITTTTLLRLDA